MNACIYEYLLLSHYSIVLLFMNTYLTPLLFLFYSESNLSHQYYGLYIYEYLRRIELKQKWKEFLSKDKQLLIQGIEFMLSAH